MPCRPLVQHSKHAPEHTPMAKITLRHIPSGTAACPQLRGGTVANRQRRRAARGRRPPHPSTRTRVARGAWPLCPRHPSCCSIEFPQREVSARIKQVASATAVARPLHRLLSRRPSTPGAPPLRADVWGPPRARLRPGHTMSLSLLAFAFALLLQLAPQVAAAPCTAGKCAPREGGGAGGPATLRLRECRLTYLHFALRPSCRLAPARALRLHLGLQPLCRMLHPARGGAGRGLQRHADTNGRCRRLCGGVVGATAAARRLCRMVGGVGLHTTTHKHARCSSVDTDPCL